MSLTANLTGTLKGTARITYDSAPSGYTALSLPGTSGNYMNLGSTNPAHFDTRVSNLFIEAWIYSNAANGSVNQQIIAVTDASTSDWNIFIGTDNLVHFGYWAPSYTEVKTGVISFAAWNHVAISWNYTTKAIYIFLNGTASGPTVTSTTGVYLSTREVHIGSETTGSVFNGYIRDIRVVQGGAVPTSTFSVPANVPFGLGTPTYVAGMGTTVMSLATQYMQQLNMTVKSIPTLFSQISSGASASAKGIYSLYAINGTNPLIINVRNGTTSATSDFYGDTSGNLKTAGGQSVSAWLAGATGYITTWYDQSGLGNHAAQATTTLQPILILGTPNLINFGGTGYFTVTNQVMPTGNGVFTTVTKLGTHPTASQVFMWGFGTTGSAGCVGLDLRTDYSPNRYEEFFYGTGDVTGPTYIANATVSGVYNQTAHTLYLNGSQIGTAAVSSRSGTSGNQYIGAINFTIPDNRGLQIYTGTMRDLYVFSTALSTTDRNILENGYSSLVPALSYGTPLFSQLSTTTVSSAVGAFSLRAVKGQTAKAVQVRRGSDNATQDFYADRLGNLLTAPVTGQPLASWLGSATGYVTTWYDQSGRGNHATQITQASQPIIDFANKQIDFKTSAWFNLPDGTVPYGNQSYTMIVRHNTLPSAINNEYDFITSGNNNTTDGVNSLGYNSFYSPYPVYVNYWWADDVYTNPNVNNYSAKNVISAVYSNVAANRSLFINGISLGTNGQITSGARNSGIGNNAIGKDARNFYINGELYYIFLFNTNLSSQDRILIESLPI